MYREHVPRTCFCWNCTENKYDDDDGDAAADDDEEEEEDDRFMISVTDYIV